MRRYERVTKLDRKISRQRRWPKLGERIDVHTFGITREDGVQQVFWFIKPDGMALEQAFESQPIHGPFQTKEQADEDQRVTIFGEQCTMTYGGEWDPAWDKPQ
jgi:hypothetical protein